MWTERLRTAVSGLVDLLLPQHCVGCELEGTVWCRECASRLGGLHRVRRPLLGEHPPVYALGAYRAAARRAVLAYKEAGRRDLAGPLAGQLGTALRAIGEDGGQRAWWLIPAPSRAIASRRRGGAHMTRIADRMAGDPAGAGAVAGVADCLLLAAGAADSAGLQPQQRRDNLAGRVLVRADRLPPAGSRIVLLDDVVTTAATAASSIAALSAAGREVELVLALTATSG